MPPTSNNWTDPPADLVESLLSTKATESHRLGCQVSILNRSWQGIVQQYRVHRPYLLIRISKLARGRSLLDGLFRVVARDYQNLRELQLHAPADIIQLSSMDALGTACSLLNRLSISAELGFGVLAHVARHCSTLRALHVKFDHNATTSTSRDALEAVVALATACPLLEEVYLSMANAMINHVIGRLALLLPKLRSLNLRGCNISDDMWRGGFPVGLQTLILNETHFGNTGVRELRLPSLSRLDLSFTNASVSGLLEAELPSLTDLSLMSSSAGASEQELCALAARFVHLESLSLSADEAAGSIEFGVAAATALASHCLQLRVLYVDLCCSLWDEQMLHRLAPLSLVDAAFAVCASDALLDALVETQPLLEELRLRLCDFGPGGSIITADGIMRLVNGCNALKCLECNRSFDEFPLDLWPHEQDSTWAVVAERLRSRGGLLHVDR